MSSPGAQAAPAALRLDSNAFELFGLPQRQAQSRAEIDERRRQLQAQVHPDKFAVEGAAAQRIAMQWAVRVNQAYQQLKDPLARAAALCALRGHAVDPHSNTAMPPAFLMQQMHWHEALDEAATASQAQALDDEIAREEAQGIACLTQLLDESDDAPAAAQQVRALMFMRRLRESTSQRLDALSELG